MSSQILQKIVVGLGLALAFSSGSASAAPDLTGTWQASTPSPRVVKIEKTPGGAYRAQMYNLGEWEGHGPLNGNAVSTVHVQGNSVTFSLDRTQGSFEGSLSKDGKTLTGTWRDFRPAAPMILERASKTKAWIIDPSPHTSRMVPVDKDVSLEVLDWGGNGPPLIFLAGQGDTAHIFDKFALNFTAKHHVYGITRRGYGASSTPAPTDANYDPDRLGDDVLAVIDALKLDHPVVAGHSLAGAELSSIGSRHPEKVSGLVYLDGVYGYAFYEPKVPFFAHTADFGTVRRDLGRLLSAGPAETQTLVAEIQATLPILQDEMRTLADQSRGQPEPSAQIETPEGLEGRTINMNYRRYTLIKAPFLVIMAVPHICAPNCNSDFAKLDATVMPALADAIAADHPTARVVRLPYARHQVWNSNEADVEREMNAFMDGLPGR